MKVELAEIRLRSHCHPGRLVVVDGSDGTGKTTLLDGLETYLVSEGKLYVRTSQPTKETRGLSAFQAYMFAPDRRSQVDYRALLCMLIGDRLQHIHQVIEPALEAGAVVLCDRYIYTQIVTTGTRDHSHERWMYDLYEHVIRPDLAFIADAPFDIVCKRISSRADWRDAFLEPDHIERNLAAFRTISEIFGLRLVDTHASDATQVVTDAVGLLRGLT